MTDAAIAASDLAKNFGTFSAVGGVTFDVGRGEVVGLLGANGAGKTTTIRMLTGLIAPTSGSAEILGGPPSREARRHLGYVPQGLGLYRDLTVLQNLAFSAGAYGVPISTLPKDLAGEADRPVGQISLGLQRQLAFAVALQHQPSVLILDEPTSGVGPLGAARLWERIRDEAGGGAAVLVSTHSMDEALECDRLLMMSMGKIVASGTEEDIVDGTIAIRVGTQDWQTAFDVLSDAGCLVMLDGTSVRVVDEDAGRIRELLSDAVDGPVRIDIEAATIDERMAVLARSA
jgi:ABC-2 type transport system ATP-binding protein/ribosome-dependent ATPase